MEFTQEQLKRAAFQAVATIKVLRKHNKVNPKTGEPYVGVHVRWSKFSTKMHEAFPFIKKYPATDLNDLLNALERAEVIACVPGRGGPTVYLWADKPEGHRTRQDESAIDAEIAAQVALLDADAILAAETDDSPNDLDRPIA